MPKNIVICADGTGNAFAKRVSNVSQLVRLLEIDKPKLQCVAYDQGLGTHPDLARAARHDAKSHKGLTVLSAKIRKPRLMPAAMAKFLGLAAGYGLRANVLQLYQELSREWRAGDRVFLFGFSRGAFTVRALAGLVYRCGLVRHEFAERGIDQPPYACAYRHYMPHEKDKDAIEKFRDKFGYPAPDACEIAFLGLWDTVKSYGGIWPQHLPHLRHNPIVHKVRHALALGEQRSWFIPTSWGGIDGEDLRRLGVAPDARYASQDVREIWFSGSHCDVGGGDAEEQTARIPLQWMLREAAADGLRLNRDSQDLLAADLSVAPIHIHESLTCGWLVSEYVPRWEIDNSTRPPRRYFRVGRTGKRDIERFSRRGKVEVHRSADSIYPLRIVKVVPSDLREETGAAARAHQPSQRRRRRGAPRIPL